MKITYDRKADALYIERNEGKFADNKKIDDSTIADLDDEGNVLGIEVLNASKRIPLDSLMDVKVLIA